MALAGLSRRGLRGMVLTAGGGYLALKGAKNYKRLYDALGVEVATMPRKLDSKAARVEVTVTIDRPRADLYRFWRKLENLPLVMGHLLKVQEDGKRSRWLAKAPAGTVVEWEAEVINDVENELIAWQSLSGSDVDTAGSVTFVDAPKGGTNLHVVMRYTMPVGPIGPALAKLLGSDPQKQMQEDLLRFKRLMESPAINISLV